MDTPPVDEVELEKILRSLRIKSGLSYQGRKRINGPWAISFEYDRGLKQFTVTIHRDFRSSTMGLQQEDVETRGKSMWLTDNTWRLSEAGIHKIMDAVDHLMARRPS